MTEYVVTGVPAHATEKVWESVEPLLDLVDMHDRLTMDDLHALVQSAHMQLRIIEPLGRGDPVAAVLTEVAVYPQMKVVRVVALGGKNMEAWIDVLNADLDAFARRVGAPIIEANVREGLARRLRDKPYGGYVRITSLVQRVVEQTVEEKETEN